MSEHVFIKGMWYKVFIYMIKSMVQTGLSADQVSKEYKA